MAGRINNIDFNPFVGDRRVLSEDGNTSFALQLVGIEDERTNLLMLPKNPALFQQAVYKSRFSMIDMSDDSNITDVVTSLVANIKSPQLFHLVRSLSGFRYTCVWRRSLASHQESLEITRQLRRGEGQRGAVLY